MHPMEVRKLVKERRRISDVSCWQGISTFGDTTAFNRVGNSVDQLIKFHKQGCIDDYLSRLHSEAERN